ncbi:MAG: hypothetical protein ACTSVF_01555 [Candidatus Asgardarchaeia archaeon]
MDYYRLVPDKKIKGEEVVAYLRELWREGVNPIEFMLVCIFVQSFRHDYNLSLENSVFVGDILQVYEDIFEELTHSVWRRGSFRSYLTKEVSKAVLSGKSVTEPYYQRKKYFRYENNLFPRQGSVMDVLGIATTSRHPLESLLLVWIKDYKSLKNIFSNIRHITALYKFKTDPKLRRRIRAKLKKLEKLKPKEREKELKRLRKEAFESVAEFR